MKSKVYFSSVITPEKVLELYKCLDITLPGNVALKVHSGEPGNQNFLRPAFWKPIVDYVGGTVVECNTAYEGGRNTTERHVQTFKKHGWSDMYTIDLLDATGPDMELELTQKQFRRLLDMVYIGNWILNSTRGEDRFRDYDEVESLLFTKAVQAGMPTLAEVYEGEIIPSRAFAEGGIHEAIALYEDNVFYEILAEELSRRDMNYPEINEDNYDEIISRMDRYMSEFYVSGVDKLILEE